MIYHFIKVCLAEHLYIQELLHYLFVSAALGFQLYLWESFVSSII